MKEKVLITGGSGFLARNLIEELDNNKFEIILLTRSDYKKALIEKSNKKLKVFLINWDDQNDVNAKLKDANYIIHTANLKFLQDRSPIILT